MPTLTLPKPHPAQEQVIDGSKRFNVLCCGQRWGKSELGMDRLLHPAEGEAGGLVCAELKLAAPAWRELQNRLHPVARDVSQQQRRLELRPFWPCPPESHATKSYLASLDEWLPKKIIAS